MTAAKVHNIPEIKAGFVKINENLRLRHSSQRFKNLIFNFSNDETVIS